MGAISRRHPIGVIQKVSEPTQWVSGLVAAEKKDGRLRKCIGRKPLNIASRRPFYPLSTVEDILPRILKAKCFSVCDVKVGFGTSTSRNSLAY